MIQNNFDGRLQDGKIYGGCLFGRKDSGSFLPYPDLAKQFYRTMSQVYSTKLYVYIADSDSWESVADQF